MLCDVEVRFDCAGSHTMRPPSLSGSTLRRIYRKLVMLCDVEVRFDCAGSHKMRPPSLSGSTLRRIYRKYYAPPRSQNISRRGKVRNVRFAFMLSTQPCELPPKVLCALLDTINCTPPPSFQIVRRNFFFLGGGGFSHNLLGVLNQICFEAKPSLDC